MKPEDKAVVQQALAKVRAAQRCHPNFVMTLLCEADELMEQLLEQPAPHPAEIEIMLDMTDEEDAAAATQPEDKAKRT
jgi:hypothetical protein